MQWLVIRKELNVFLISRVMVDKINLSDIVKLLKLNAYKTRYALLSVIGFTLLVALIRYYYTNDLLTLNSFYVKNKSFWWVILGGLSSTWIIRENIAITTSYILPIARVNKYIVHIAMPIIYCAICLIFYYLFSLAIYYFATQMDGSSFIVDSTVYANIAKMTKQFSVVFMITGCIVVAQGVLSFKQIGILLLVLFGSIALAITFLSLYLSVLVLTLVSVLIYIALGYKFINYEIEVSNDKK